MKSMVKELRKLLTISNLVIRKQILKIGLGIIILFTLCTAHLFLMPVNPTSSFQAFNLITQDPSLIYVFLPGIVLLTNYDLWRLLTEDYFNNIVTRIKNKETALAGVILATLLIDLVFLIAIISGVLLSNSNFGFADYNEFIRMLIRIVQLYKVILIEILLVGVFQLLFKKVRITFGLSLTIMFLGLAIFKASLKILRVLPIFPGSHLTISVLKYQFVPRFGFAIDDLWLILEIVALASLMKSDWNA